MPSSFWMNWNIPWWERMAQNAWNQAQHLFQGSGGGAVGAPPTAQAGQPQQSGMSPQDFLKSLGFDPSSLAGGGGGGAAAFDGYVTPDGVQIKNGSAEDRYYKLVDAIWTKFYGAHPDFAQARTFHDMGVENTDQLNQIMLQMPSHIKGPDGTPITLGVYEDMLTEGNKSAQKYLGRPIPDSLITQWVKDGLTTPAAIDNWFYSHPASDIPKDQYGAAWDAANQWTQQVWGQFKG